MVSRDALVAASRFGLGARPGDLDVANPRGGLDAAVGGTAEPLPTGLSTTRDLIARVREMDRSQEAKQRLRREARDLYRREAVSHAEHAITTEDPLRERMVACWTNHFTVSVTRPPVVGLAHAYEREAIRPHVYGRFSDMLLAVARHPAMLLYLDNARSTGPDSLAGRRRGLGLNENLAREILELHTLGVDGGYGQDDVEALAAILTGWSVDRSGESADGFRFDARRHEPGRKTLLGVRYPEGRAAGEQALRDLARHPSTATHVATRLCRHFVADLPPQPVVRRVATVFLDTDGDLAAVTRALVDEPAAWRTPLARLRQPRDLVLATARALGIAKGEPAVRALRLLGQAPFSAPSPAGWPDEDAAWAGPEAVLERVEFAHLAASRRPTADPSALAEAVLGPALSRDTARAIHRAPDASTGLTLLLASPEFQRR